jgi:hypothetical protein
VKETPMIFTGHSVRGLQLGTKTQTRRVVKQQPRGQHGLQSMWGKSPDGFAFGTVGHFREVGADYPDDESDDRFAPAAPGDRLWCKETWSPHIAHGCAGNTCDCADVNVIYEADGASRIFLEREIPNDWTFPKSAAKGLVSPLFMPRWASRITLEVTEVRAQRLQEITEEDAEEEGLECAHLFGSDRYRRSYAHLWDILNAKRGFPWSSNPWIWALSFKRIEQPETYIREMSQRSAR